MWQKQLNFHEFSWIFKPKSEVKENQIIPIPTTCVFSLLYQGPAPPSWPVLTRLAVPPTLTSQLLYCREEVCSAVCLLFRCWKLISTLQKHLETWRRTSSRSTLLQTPLETPWKDGWPLIALSAWPHNKHFKHLSDPFGGFLIFVFFFVFWEHFKHLKSHFEGLALFRPNLFSLYFYLKRDFDSNFRTSSSPTLIGLSSAAPQKNQNIDIHKHPFKFFKHWLHLCRKILSFHTLSSFCSAADARSAQETYFDIDCASNAMD